MAGFGIRAPLAQLRKLVRTVGALGTPQTRAGMSRALGQEALKLVRDGFRAQRDPYGHPWQRPGLADDDQRTLQDTGNLVNSFHVRSNAQGFTVSSGARYASTHQYGATIVPRNKPFLVFDAPVGSSVRVVRSKPGRVGRLLGGTARKQFVKGAFRKQGGVGVRERGAIGRGGRGIIKLGNNRLGSLMRVRRVVIPRRTMVPEPQFGGLGPIWSKAFARVGSGLFARKLRNGASVSVSPSNGASNGTK